MIRPLTAGGHERANAQMTPETRDYLLAPGADPHVLAAALCAGQSCVVGDPESLQRRFFDSFDWRLYAVGAVLEERRRLGPLDPATAAPAGSGRSHELIWHELDSGNSGPRQPAEREPGLIDSLPAGPVREQVAPLLAMRRLLPVIEVVSHRMPVRVLNDDEKTVVRASIERARWRDPASDREEDLGGRLRLRALRGYDAEFAAVTAVVEDRLDLARAGQSLPAAALAVSARPPGGYSTKLDYRLERGQRADAATKIILRGLHETLEANLDGARRGLDSEFLHDFRVAVRRTRSALGQIKGVFPETVVGDFKARFAWLQQVTGPVRDLDVYLLDLPLLEQGLPGSLRAELRPLRELVTAHLERERTRLADTLGSDAVGTLLRDWSEFLAAPLPPANVGDLPKHAARPVEQVADRRIGRLLERVRTEGRTITDTSPAEALHELRKSCKKLRYLMEFFRSLYPKRAVSAQINQTKQLLDHLGRFQDTAVQASHLRASAEELHRSAHAGAGTLLALGALIGRLAEEQARIRGEFASVFDAFDSRDNAERFAELLGASIAGRG